MAEKGTTTVAATKVEVRTLKWPQSLYGKQHSKSQGDTFGSYQKYVALVNLDDKGKEIRRVSIQSDGKPVTGSVPTFQRQMIKLLVAAFFTQGTTKGEGFSDAVALNLVGNLDWLSKLFDGWYIDAGYGAPTSERTRRMWGAVKDLVTIAQAGNNVRNATVAKYPVAEETKSSSTADPTFEEVSLVL
jgi:hypothetical protein